MRREEHSKEIQQESIKQQLNEIITDIEKNVQISNDDVTDNSNVSFLTLTWLLLLDFIEIVLLKKIREWIFTRAGKLKREFHEIWKINQINLFKETNFLLTFLSNHSAWSDCKQFRCIVFDFFLHKDWNLSWRQANKIVVKLFS